MLKLIAASIFFLGGLGILHKGWKMGQKSEAYSAIPVIIIGMIVTLAGATLLLYALKSP